MPIIELRHVTKEFRLGQIQSLKESIWNATARLRGESIKKRPPFRALDDINLTLEEGEVLGIIGHNGAGKSTLLKLLAGISRPTHGAVTVHGRVAPLIEVGAGLVPDLTGRENIYLNATILGMTRNEIMRKFDEIVAFAEVEEFIDTPIKRYSTGMMVRLGFSIATSVQAPILIVDEVLAVGDLAFQRKCFDRLEDMIKRQGKTVLLVSHNIRQVVRLCTRTILLDRGKVTSDGHPAAVTELFYEQSNRKIQANQVVAANANARIRTSGEIELLDINLLDLAGRIIQGIVSGGALRIQVKLLVHRPIKKPEVVVGTHTTDFVYLTAASTGVFDNRPDFEPGIHVVEYHVPSFPLVAGTYCARLAAFDANGRLILAGETLRIFHVTSLPGEAKQPPLRNLHLPTAWVVDNQEFSEMPNNATPSAAIVGHGHTKRVF